MPAKKVSAVKKEIKEVSPKKTVVKKVTVVKKSVAAKSSEANKSVHSSVEVSAKIVEKKTGSLKIEVYDLSGKVIETISLSKEIFGEVVNKKLLAQAVRVYLANKRQGNASTKTRGEVNGSTRKIYKQKGTGKARHGSIRAPIFVKGGVVHGPKPRDFSLELPKKMRRKALLSALSGKFQDNEIKVLSGFEKITPKTKEFIGVLGKLEIESKKRKMLIVMPDNFENAKRASGNVTGVRSTTVQRLNALDVLNTRNLLIAKEAISEMEKYFLSKE